MRRSLLLDLQLLLYLQLSLIVDRVRAVLLMLGGRLLARARLHLHSSRQE